MQDIVLCVSTALLYENSQKPRWMLRRLVLTQTFLIIHKDDVSSFLTEEEDGRVSLKGLSAKLSTTNDPQWTCQVNLLASSKRFAFRVKALDEGETWVRLLTMGASWTNYQAFCEFEKVQPWHQLLHWACANKDLLEIDLEGLNSFAVLEFIRNNPFIRGLALVALNDQITVLARVLSYFPSNQLAFLDLRRSKLTDNSLEKAKKAIAANSALSKLDLSDNLLTAQCIPTLFFVVSSMPKLEHLLLAGNSLGDAGLAAFLPECLRLVRLRTLNLSRCKLSLPDPILRTLKIRRLPLTSLVLDSNEFAQEHVRMILMKRRKRWRAGYSFTVHLNPLPMNEQLLRLVYGVRDISIQREMIHSRTDVSKPLPILARHRHTIEAITTKVQKLYLDAEVYVEELEEMASQLAQLDFQFPKSKVKMLEDLMDNKISQVVAARGAPRPPGPPPAPGAAPPALATPR